MTYEEDKAFYHNLVNKRIQRDFAKEMYPYTAYKLHFSKFSYEKDYSELIYNIFNRYNINDIDDEDLIEDVCLYYYPVSFDENKNQQLLTQLVKLTEQYPIQTLTTLNILQKYCKDKDLIQRFGNSFLQREINHWGNSFNYISNHQTDISFLNYLTGLKFLAEYDCSIDLIIELLLDMKQYDYVSPRLIEELIDYICKMLSIDLNATVMLISLKKG